MKKSMLSPSFEQKLQKYGITRREFLKVCGTMATIIGSSQSSIPSIARAIENAAKKPSVVWSQYSSCSGCSESLLKAGSPSAAKVILDIISLDYHNTIMAAAGSQNKQVLDDILKSSGFIWLVEGGIPTNKGHGQIFDEEIQTLAKKTAAKAKAIVAIGTCASFGGIPGAAPNPSGVVPVSKAVDKSVINISGCPPNPDWIVATLVYYLTYKKVPDLDKNGRPLFIYKQTIHDLCPRRGMFEAGKFVPYPGAPEESLGYCLYRVGCKAPASYGNCPVVLYNQKTNWCNGAGQCIGCTDNSFPESMMGFYDMLPGIGIPGFRGVTTTADTLGAIAGAATVAGIGIHAAMGLVKGPKGKVRVKKGK